jgi:hypothetical protein
MDSGFRRNDGFWTFDEFIKSEEHIQFWRDGAAHGIK